MCHPSLLKNMLSVPLELPPLGVGEILVPLCFVTRTVGSGRAGDRGPPQARREHKLHHSVDAPHARYTTEAITIKSRSAGICAR